MGVYKAIINLVLVRLYLLVHFVARICIFIYAVFNNQVKFSDLIFIFPIGLINDIVSLFYILPIVTLLNILFINVIFRNSSLNTKLAVSFIGCFLLNILLACDVVSLLIFWDEFGTSFNFIAVDYLIYTHEIIGTVQESLPIRSIIAGIICSALLLTFVFHFIVINNLKINIRDQLLVLFISIMFASGCYSFYDSERLILTKNQFAIEIAKNGPYEFASAFFKNSLNYQKLYSTLHYEEAIKIVRDNIVKPNEEFVRLDGIRRVVNYNANKGNKYNVIFIIVESLSAEFLGCYGSKQNITPYLDKIAKESLVFTQVYAAGTRTVRGLEALTLSIPPTPGSSIIRRPNNNNLFNIGTVFRTQGYNTNFIFGGYSYFDNLENYFSSNDFKIIDRSSLKSKEISFSNIWGVADEDILKKSIEQADMDYSNDKPFFSMIMTTSNHRPYSFPEGRIDLPARGGGRAAAVKYTDYAIGKFIELATTKPWFQNTIFVITADHCASSAGKIRLPVQKYHIPLIIYAPNIVKKGQNTSLSSQIDIPPTIFGLLGFPYESNFFGTDILKFPAKRAFISTYQLLGYMKDDHLVIVSPKSKPVLYKIQDDAQLEVNNKRTDLIREAISFYQVADFLYRNNGLKE